tara:strand:- start:1102 stop:1554 length:453 start_codon:yes stop_codon:yes gene_type:complete
MIEIVVGCLFPILLTANTLPEYQECLYVQDNIKYVSTHADLVSRYFKEEDIPIALNVIYCESSGRPQAIGNNTNGTRDVGLWQFNDKTWAWLTPKLGIIKDRTNPETSTAVAAWLVYNDGWHHWNSSKHCWKGTNNDLLWTQIKQSMRGN